MPIEQLEQACAANSFSIESYTSQDPDVVLLKDVLTGCKSWLAVPIENIVRACIRPGETLLISDSEGKVILPSKDIVGYGIFRYLRDINAGFVGNDSWEAMKWHEAAMMWMHFATQTGTGEQVSKALSSIEEAIKYRAQHILNGPFGLTQVEGRRFQVVGNDYLWSALPGYLDRRKLSYARVVPTKAPSHASIRSYEFAVECLMGDDEHAKVVAIEVIAAAPVRGSVYELTRAAQWPKHSQRVQDLARRRAEQLGSRESGDTEGAE